MITDFLIKSSSYLFFDTDSFSVFAVFTGLTVSAYDAPIFDFCTSIFNVFESLDVTCDVN